MLMFPVSYDRSGTDDQWYFELNPDPCSYVWHLSLLAKVCKHFSRHF